MKVRGVRQHDITDCGAACLVYVAAWHGLHVSVMETAVLAQTDENGTTVYGMLKAAEKLGFESHAVRCDPDFLVQLTSPAIAHVLSVNGHTHYVAISAGKNGLIQVMDPANGRVSRIGIQLFTEYWTGVLILLSPGDGFRKNLPLPKWKPLKLAGARHYSSILMVLALAIVQSILAMAMPLFLKKVVDDVVQNGNAGELMMQG
jgi:ABC-type bacteriocin/lantibiotic exporter with double-glycine peptidase domain